MIFLKKLFGDKPLRRPDAGQWVHEEPADRMLQRGNSPLTPERAGQLLVAADSGDIAQLCWAASVIELENWDVRQAMETRRLALSGCDWHIAPGDDSEAAKSAADAFADALKTAGTGVGNEFDTFDDLMSDMMTAVISPFAASEIIWQPGGGVAGFSRIDPWHFTLRDSLRPRLITTNEPNGIELPPHKILLHSYRRGGDFTRRGLIRTLIWLHVFQNFPIKDLLGFVERFGMPFVIARIDNATWDKERGTIQRLIRSFGSCGGGVFTRATEVQLLQAANNTGEIYFRLLDYTGAAITRCILGQTASSSDGGGLSKDNAQSQVRQDILEADARAIEGTTSARLAAPWASFHFGPGVGCPLLQIESEQPEDQKQAAEVREIDARTIQSLSGAGWQVADPAVLKDRFGFAFLRPAAAPAQQPVQGAPAADAETLNLKQKYDAMGVAIRAGLLTATPEIEEQTRRELRLPAISDAVRKAWQATGGIRQPITLKTAEAEAVNAALDVNDADTMPMSAEQRLNRGAAIVSALGNGLIHRTADVDAALAAAFGVSPDSLRLAAEDSTGIPGSLADRATKELFKTGALTRWLGPMEEEIAALAAEEDPETVKRKLSALLANPAFGSSGAFERVLEKLAATGIAEGAVVADARRRSGRHG